MELPSRNSWLIARLIPRAFGSRTLPSPFLASPTLTPRRELGEVVCRVGPDSGLLTPRLRSGENGWNSSCLTGNKTENAMP